MTALDDLTAAAALFGVAAREVVHLPDERTLNARTLTVVERS